jgi:hypothetical protein
VSGRHPCQCGDLVVITAMMQSIIDWVVYLCGGNHRDISDGHHTFGELYEHRMLYHAAFVKLAPAEYESHKSRNHNDGGPCFGGKFFVVSSRVPGLVTNHYKLEHWDLFDIPAEPNELWEFDGSTPQDSRDCLRKFCGVETTEM